MFASALVLLGACSHPVRKSPEIEAENPRPAIIATQPTPPPVAPVETVPAEPIAESAPVAPKSIWPRVIDGYAFSDCDHASTSQLRWQRTFLQSPERHAQSLAAVAPFLAYVANELTRRDLPMEFVWLPYVESGYYAFRSRGDRPAGAWQLMPATARWRGLKIDRHYDGRLDFVAASGAALDLIEHLATVFDRNWPLVTMAYNAGEYRIKGAIERARKASKSLSPEDLAVSATTHEHLNKLRALACIAENAATLGLELPEFDESTQLVAVVIDKRLSTSQLAAAAGASTEQWLRWNPAWYAGHADAGAQILVPLYLRDAAIARVVNAAPAPAIAASRSESVAAAGGVHVVRRGESAWSIARKYRVSLRALLSANGLNAKSVLRPGQRLRLP